MKKWIPIGVVAVLIVLIGAVVASNSLNITGQARGIQSAETRGMSSSKDAVCPKGKSADRLRGCEEGTVLECENERHPFCCECVEEPTLTCANALCTAQTTCVMDCDESPVCVPQVCEGFAGLACPEGFECDADGENPDEGGTCEPDCEEGPTCETVLCEEGSTCVEDCDGAPVCASKVCGGIAGVSCPEGFVCDGSDAHPDAQGTCVADCEEECGVCKSDDECEKGDHIHGNTDHR